MKLTLGETDLRKEHQTMAGTSSKVTFEMLSPEAQAAVRIIGIATYWAPGGDSFNEVHPPKEASCRNA